MNYFLKIVNSKFELQNFLDTCRINHYTIQHMTQQGNKYTILYTV